MLLVEDRWKSIGVLQKQRGGEPAGIGEIGASALNGDLYQNKYSPRLTPGGDGHQDAEWCFHSRYPPAYLGSSVRPLPLRSQTPL